jgi:methylated-DNA-protein-cysteine methyltransferase related protein
MPAGARAEEVLRRVRAVPAGFVTTYGDLCPAAPRFAGQVLARCHDPDIPWQRVVRADGSLAKGSRQRRLLDREGTPFQGQRVEMGLARIPAEGLDELTAATPAHSSVVRPSSCTVQRGLWATSQG